MNEIAVNKEGSRGCKADNGWTFGIISGGADCRDLSLVVQSIRNQKIENYEIIIAAPELNEPTLVLARDVNWLNTSDLESKLGDNRPFPISSKKNRICKNAMYENICLLHDYVALANSWYAGMIEFCKRESSWDIVAGPVLNHSGLRDLDWVCIDHPANYFNPKSRRLLSTNRLALLPYDAKASSYQYIVGYVWVAKRSFMLAHPLNEKLRWNMAEDIEWSRRVRKVTNFQMNKKSGYYFVKPKISPADPNNEFHSELIENSKILQALWSDGRLDAWYWIPIAKLFWLLKGFKLWLCGR